MKNAFFVLMFAIAFIGKSQTKTELQKHYEDYYKEMRKQGDVTGIVSALTHLNVISPSKERRDTLAYIYANDGKHLQALNTIGIKKHKDDSNLAVQVKAISFKALNQPRRALEQFEILNKRLPSPYLAYELADLKIQLGNNAGAMINIAYGLANSKDDMKYIFYERQEPYQASLKASFMHLKALMIFNQDKTNYDNAIKLINKALTIDPNFNLASLSKQALELRKDAAIQQNK